MIEEGDIKPPQPAEKKQEFPWGGLWMVSVLLAFILGYVEARPHVDKAKLGLPVGSVIGANAWTLGNLTTTTTNGVEQQYKAEEERNKSWKNKPILAAPEDAPPSRIKVGPHVYKVRYTTRKALSSQGAIALTNLVDRIIWLNPHDDLRYELTHELTHCAKDVGSDGERLQGQFDGEENFVEETSPTWLRIIQDNPELVEWLTRK